MLQIFFAALAMSVLRSIWEPPPKPAEPAHHKVRGFRNRIQVDEARAARSRSPKGRHHCVKAMLFSWAQGNSSAVTVWRLCNAMVNNDGSDVGHGTSRLANLGSGTSGSEKNCADRQKNY